MTATPLAGSALLLLAYVSSATADALTGCRKRWINALDNCTFGFFLAAMLCIVYWLADAWRTGGIG